MDFKGDTTIFLRYTEVCEIQNTNEEASTVKPTRSINVANSFYWSKILHVSDGLSVHHQELKTVHTATGICQTDTAVCTVLNS
jgi:hypothetical protein